MRFGILRASLAGFAIVLAACQPLPTRPVTPAPETPKPVAEAASTVEEVPETPAPDRTYLMPELDGISDGQTLFARLTGRFMMPPCAAQDDAVQRWIHLHTRRPGRFRAELEASMPLMALAVEEIERLALPGEYALVPIIESGYRPDARGTGDHAGLWQFGAPTARTRGLPVRADYDARLAPRASTRAALSYLAQLQNEFVDPRLAMFAYNAGPYRVHKLLDGAQARGEDAPPRQLRGLPKISADYVARLRALTCILAQPQRFNVELPQAAFDPLRIVTLPTGASSLAAIAKELALDASALARLNPAFRRGYIAPDAPREMLVPASQLPAFASLDALPFAPAPKPSAADTHVVARGDTLGAIARRYRIPLAELMAMNNLNHRSVLRIGQRVRLAR